MRVLGVTGPKHDAAAALFVDGELVAAAEEERFVRSKHALRHPPRESVRYVLDAGGLAPQDVDAIAYPWCEATWRANRGRHLARTWRTEGVTAVRGWWKTVRRFRRLRARVRGALDGLGVPWAQRPWHEVPHHDAHAASAFLLSGFEDCAVLTVDGLGEQVTTQVGAFEDGRYTVLHREHMPHSLGCFYSAMTEYLGWRFNDGEYKLMGMAPYGEASKVDLEDIAWLDARGAFRMDPTAVWVAHRRRVDGKAFGRPLVERLGPPRRGDGLDAPYPDIAAATQAVFERALLALVEGPLSPVLQRTGRLAYAGGCALNVALNRRLVQHATIDRLYVPPGANDGGTAVGAAAWVAWQAGDRIRPRTSAALGPSFDDAAIQAALQARGLRAPRVHDVVATTADLLAAGRVVGWFQGRMEMGPRALGQRSILAHPALPGMSDRVNEAVKHRETWRPFCPSIRAEAAQAILGSDHPAPHMTIAFDVAPAWRERIAQVVHVDGTCRPQVVHADDVPLFHALLTAFEARTGLPVLMNTSLNRRGEPIVATPGDALTMWADGGLDVLVLGDRVLER
jgi:carbamoyltransferase